MRTFATATLLVGLLLAIPLAAAESVTVILGTDGNCQTDPVGASTPPGRRPEVHVASEDCDSSATSDSDLEDKFGCLPMRGYVLLSPYGYVFVGDCNTRVVLAP